MPTSTTVTRLGQWCFALIVAGLCSALARAEDTAVLAEDYLTQWSAFYPTQALAEGKSAAAGQFENYSAANVEAWLSYNRQLSERLESMKAPASPEHRADLAVLKKQVAAEQLLWREDPLATQPQWYARQVSQALTYLLVRESLVPSARYDALLVRLRGIEALCRQGSATLVAGRRLQVEGAARSLAATARFFRDGLPAIVASWPVEDGAGGSEEIAEAANAAADAALALRDHLLEKVVPVAETSPALGKDLYSEKLALRSSGALTPESLASAALEEVETVRQRMVAEATRWWRSRHGEGRKIPEDAALLAAALEAMESERDSNSGDFLAQYSTLTKAAEDFVREHGIATVPTPTTLHIALSPEHFAGAAVGGVYPAGPWSPGADTLFYLPSIPDDVSAEVAEGFYRSFNHHFNTMIISHEMFPGHYLQYKVAVTSAPPLRPIFADGAYVEGWGTFSEELMLNAGWGQDNPLTWLAHYRKRLENATRSYVSVMVHTQGWVEADVTGFAVERGLLAPQFAINLWQRVVNTPMQITDYFVGYRQFKSLWASRRAGQAGKFDQRALVDAVLRAGPLPVPSLQYVLD